ncbi:amino acid permease [Umezawaea endophytica]|uniref:Amino acid permease n=1 Tax=Umezawaea endophytica TaxID=1654476 RepID=A0A9X3AIK7_9PSEU|nr:amino acid permease [Umezawaea endophytica]MCS7483257.1 amino acid permease [Umezawaea endophytica]
MSGFRQRHLTMIALGGAIGSGLFVGTGAGIAAAGPGILISFAAAAALALLVLRMLGEMAAAYPSTGSFSFHAEKALGRWAGFTVGWLYWLALVVVLAVEASAAAKIATGWLPAVPQWAWVLLFMATFTTINLFDTRKFGEFEFWFAWIKVAAIIAFLTIGVLAITGLLPATDSPGLTNLTAHGFFPNGWSGAVAGLLIVVFAFGGIEVVTIAAAETPNPAAAVAKAIKDSVLRVVIFYLGSLTVVVILLPYNDSTVSSSPYTAVLSHLGIPAAAPIMSAVIFTALLSALNATLYGASRMLSNLADRNDAPKSLRTNGVPRRAVLFSTTFGFLSVLLNALYPDTIFLVLISAAGSTVLIVWTLITLSQLRLRKHLEQTTPHLLTFRMWAHPYLSYLALAGIATIVILMATDPIARLQLLCAAGVTTFVLICAAIHTRWLNKANALALSDS